MDMDPEADSDEGRYLKSLSDEISEYEKRFQSSFEPLTEKTDKPNAVKVDVDGWKNQLKHEDYKRKTDKWYNFKAMVSEKFWGAVRWVKDTPYNLRRLKWSFVRARKGWAPNDTWSFDHYLNGVLRDGLRHLAEHTHGHPGFYNSHEEWQEFLRSVAQAIEDYEKEEDDTHTHLYEPVEVWTKRRDEKYAAMQKKLHEMVDVWGHLWD